MRTEAAFQAIGVYWRIGQLNPPRASYTTRDANIYNAPVITNNTGIRRFEKHGAFTPDAFLRSKTARDATEL